MSLRLKHTRRKDYKTEESILPSGISYLSWKKYPKELEVNSDSVGKRVWIAGTGFNEEWFVSQYYEPGTDMYPEGGMVVHSKKDRDISIFLREAILHPEYSKQKRKKKK